MRHRVYHIARFIDCRGINDSELSSYRHSRLLFTCNDDNFPCVSTRQFSHRDTAQPFVPYLQKISSTTIYSATCYYSCYVRRRHSRVYRRVCNCAGNILWHTSRDSILLLELNCSSLFYVCVFFSQKVPVSPIVIGKLYQMLKSFLCAPKKGSVNLHHRCK